ncbi:RAB6-interacting golgin-like isoform X2 [Patiria miniata]|nr:RAB6-interacting golgin-like isoform X2 [Patiria miniata]
MAWTGFTDEQLRRLKSGSEQEPGASHQPVRRANESHSQRNRPQTTRPPPQRGKGLPPAQNPAHRTEPLSLNQSQMLSKPKQLPQQQRQRTNQRTSLTETPGPDGAPSNHDSDGTKPPVQGNQSDRRTPVDQQSDASREKARTNSGKGQNASGGGTTTDGSARERTADGTANKSEAPIGKELNEKEGLSRELTKLEEFQQRQKEIEDENQRKKNLLAMAIADRKKKTQAEVKRLAFIQKELSTIEEFLTTDVNILRDKIEEASRHYSEAQKRYQKAEAEFVTAKMSLHKASEHKEALTEHLCTIIRENELRKSKKLEELVEKLETDNLAAYEAQMEAAEAAKKAESQRHPSSSLDDTETTPVSSGPNPPIEKVPREPGQTNTASGTETSHELTLGSSSQTHESTNPTPGEETKAPQGQSSTHTSGETDSPAVSSQGRSSSTSTSGDVTTLQEVAEPVSTSDPNLATRNVNVDMKPLSTTEVLNNNLTTESEGNQT